MLPKCKSKLFCVLITTQQAGRVYEVEEVYAQTFICIISSIFKCIKVKNLIGHIRMRNQKRWHLNDSRQVG